MTTQVIELGGQLAAKRQEWGDFYSKFDKLGDANAPVMTGEDLTKFKAYEKEVTELQAKFDQASGVVNAMEANRKSLEEGLQIPGGRTYTGAAAKTLYDQIKAKGIGFLRSQAGVDFNDVDTKAWLEGKTTMTTSANGYPPEVLRDGTVVPKISRPPQLIDYLIMQPTTQNGIKFMKQSTRTNSAAAASEGSAVAESAITYTESTDIISKIGTFIPVTQEELEDEPGLQAMINQDLVLMVRQELDRNVTVGTGSAPELRGIFNASSVQTQARGSDPTLDAIFKAITKVRVTGRSNPGLVVLHGTDHQFLALTRTSDGLYILGNPTDSAVQRVWGLPIVLSEALTVTNGLVLDPNYFRVMMRTGVNIAISDSHASNFIASILAIRATVRAGLKKMRDEAACTITGLPTS